MAREAKVPLGLAHVPLRDQIRDQIRNRIVRGEMAPGSKMIERELATELGVSRVPVREALRMLETEGFVDVIPRRGVVVKHLSRTDVEELFDVRESLEALTARRAAERATEASLRRLRRHLDRAHRAAQANKVDQFGDANLAFHDEIAAIAQNSLLETILEPLRGRLDWLFRQADDPERLCAEHEQLYEAIASGDAAAAGSVAVHHVNSSRATALRLLFDEKSDAADSKPA
jgi:DNA-binding GntR family transcriptional regulator